MYIDSGDIKVYPTTLREDNIDIGSRANLEQNIASLVNRLTGQKSFIIDGIIDGISENSFILEGNLNKLNMGRLNINGYLFSIESVYDLSSLNNKNGILAFKIKTDEVIVQVAEGVDSKITRLSGTDDSGKYKGLELDVYSSVEEKNGNIYLPIAAKITKDNTNIWQPIDTAKLRFNSNDIMIGLTDLTSYLNNDLVIDDGEL